MIQPLSGAALSSDQSNTVKHGPSEVTHSVAIYMVSDCFIMICSYCSKSKANIIQYSHPSMCPFGSSWCMFLCLVNIGLSFIMSFISVNSCRK